MHEKLLDEYTERIDEMLSAHFDALLEEADSYHPFIHDVYKQLAEYCLRKGKRLSSCSTLLVYKGYVGNVDEKILRACVAIELYRHSILVTDDLVDEDDVRRGGKAFHKLFDDKGARFGDAVAIFAGNLKEWRGSSNNYYSRIFL